MTSVYVFFTDPHIGSGTEYASSRLADQDDTLIQIARVAADVNADAVLMGGDCYHRPHPSNDARTVVQRFCDRLADEGLPMIAVLGNSGHDIESVDRATALGLHASEFVHVSRASELILAPGELAVATLPSVQLGRLVAARDGGDRQEIFADAVDLLLRTAKDLHAEVPEGWPSVLLGHWACDWPGMPTQVADHGPVLPLAELDAIGFDMVLMGHIHIPQRVGNVISGGPPAHVSFGEAGLDHGCWVLTVNGPDEVEAEFVPLIDRPFVTVDVDVVNSGALTDLDDGSPSPLDPTDLIAAELSALDLTDSVLRIRYRATEQQHRRVDQGALKRLALDKGCHRVYQVVPDIVRENRARAEGVDETLGPLEALSAWTVANDIADAPAVALDDLTQVYLAKVAP